MRARQSIVSLAPSVTSILWALGAQRDVVGVSKWCGDVARVGRRPRVGDCWAAEMEPIARLQPTLLIGSVPFQAETLAQLLKIEAAFVAMNPRSLADVYGDIELLGKITGRTAAAVRVISEMKRELKAIAASNRHAHRPRVYSEAWPNPRISSPPWVAELIGMAGGIPAVPGGRKTSDEQVAAARPDVIILAWAATGAKADARRALHNPAWSEVPAVRAGRVFVIRDELLNTPSPILVRGARELARAIHTGERPR